MEKLIKLKEINGNYTEVQIDCDIDIDFLNSIDANPFCIISLKEMELINPLKKFLASMISLKMKNCYVFMTSNIGYPYIIISKKSEVLFYKELLESIYPNPNSNKLCNPTTSDMVS
jgi:hypothetical protein